MLQEPNMMCLHMFLNTLIHKWRSNIEVLFVQQSNNISAAQLIEVYKKSKKKKTTNNFEKKWLMAILYEAYVFLKCSINYSTN